MSNDTRRQKPKTAAQLASEANTLQQRAVHTNSPRPGDRQMGDLQGSEPGKQPKAGGTNAQR